MTTTTPPAGFDPWPEASDARPARTDDPGSPAVPPFGWHHLRPATRATLGAEAVALLAAHPDKRKSSDLGWLAHRLLERVRGTRVAVEVLGAANPLGLLSDLARKLIHAEGLLASLHERRAELERTIVAVEKMVTAGTPVSPPASTPEPEAPKSRAARTHGAGA